MHLFFPYWLSSLGNASKEHVDCSLEKNQRKTYIKKDGNPFTLKKKTERFEEMMILFLLIQKKKSRFRLSIILQQSGGIFENLLGTPEIQRLVKQHVITK